MFKWIVILVCASVLTACGSMSPMSSGGPGEASYSSGAGNVHNDAPGAWGSGTFGDSGP